MGQIEIAANPLFLFVHSSESVQTRRPVVTAFASLFVFLEELLRNR